MPAEFAHPAKLSTKDGDITSLLEALAMSTSCCVFPYVLLNIQSEHLKELCGVGTDLVDPRNAAPKPLEG